MLTAIAIERVEQARAGIRRVIQQWNPADLDRADASRLALEQCVSCMSEFSQALQSGSVVVTAELRNTLLALKLEIAQVTRLVDACAAYHRGLAASLGVGNPGYDAAGRISPDLVNLEHEMHV